ncbi:hypothetical protein K2173_027402 [Erythroxylum novogranatense]|uniref:Transmembrane protein n=1 Tax=Erythroxylum novogranatense TaxID=1862640 RepID=A0AAV8TZ40_9ROSI|nr:hypothetical protein K2173_027402 [Erythroxylum novogranatense]
MVVTSPQDGPASSKRLRIGLLLSVSSLVALVAKRARLVSKKLKAATNTHSNHDCLNHHTKFNHSPSMQPRSPLARPKQLLTQISNTLMHNNKKRHGRDENDDDLRAEDFGDGGVWQRAILMGDRCEPLDFSGVIYYDNTGKQLKDAPLRSPRASPLPGYLARAK